MLKLLGDFRGQKYPDSQVASHFVGYFGEHPLLFPKGTTQLAGEFSFQQGLQAVSYGKLPLYHIPSVSAEDIL
jgi:hypothetical protein